MKITADNCIEVESGNPFFKNPWRKRIMYIDMYNENNKTYISDFVMKQSAINLMHRHTYFTGITEGRYVFIIRFATVKEKDVWELDAMLGGIFHEAEKLGTGKYEETCKTIISKTKKIMPQTEKEFRRHFPL